MMGRFGIYFVNGCLAIIALCIGLLLFWVVEPARPLISLVAWTTNDVSGKEKRQFEAGETVYSWREIETKTYAFHTKVWRVIILDTNNETIATYEVQPIPSPVGKSVRTVKIVTLPKDAKIGHYHTRTYAVYQLNPIREATYELLPRVTFEVVR